MKIKNIFPCLFKQELTPKESVIMPLDDLKAEYSEFELLVAAKILYERKWTYGAKKELFLDPYLSSIAREHSRYMAIAGKPSHDGFPIRLQQAQEFASAKWVGEIVAYGYSTSFGVVNGWIKSPSHKAILTKEKATHYGISIETDVKGKNYFTVLFSQR